MSTPAPLPLDTDQRLPPDLIGQGHGWFGRYRQHLVYSPQWTRLRLGPWTLGIALWLGLALLVTVQQSADDPLAIPRTSLVGGVLLLVVVAALGPWVASRLCTRLHGSAGLQSALLIWMLLLAGTSTALKEALLEDAPATIRATLTLRLVGFVLNALLMFTVAGGWGLFTRQRQLRQLHALQQARRLADAQRRQRETEMRLSVLAAQVEPHFLFNTLAGIRSAISGDPERATLMVDHLVGYLRSTIPQLREGGPLVSSLRVQLDVVRNYLSLMSQRHRRLQFSIGTAPELLDCYCPPLMLISLVENAIKHGIEPKPGPAHIEVSASVHEDGRLLLSVCDDGVGFGASSSGSGVGLSNIRSRLAQLFDGQAALQLKNRDGGGVQALLLLPRRPAED